MNTLRKTQNEHITACHFAEARVGEGSPWPTPTHIKKLKKIPTTCGCGYFGGAYL